MIIYTDLLTGDELFSDAHKYELIEDEFFIKAEGKWVTLGDVDIDIGANPSAEGGDDEGVESTSRKVVDLIDGFQLNEMPGMGKKDFMGWAKPWVAKVVEALPDDKKDEFKAKATPGIKYLLGKIKDLQFFVGESLDPDGTMCFAYYDEGASNPTFLYPKYALKEVKC